MKIVCDSCSTKYSISDDKVRGKVFKIRCKKCSHIIVVKGTTDVAPAAPEAPADAVWHLVVDGDQVGPLTDSDVRARLARSEITAENYVWKEGFGDWLRLADVPEFADVASSAEPASASFSAPVGGELFSDSGSADATEIGQRDGGGFGGFFGAGATSSDGGEPAFSLGASGGRGSSGRGRTTSSEVPVDDDAFSAPAGGAAPAGEGADLFGAVVPVARVESGRVRGRANGAGASGRHDGGRVENLTAQRSENSVLFSLSNLQSLAAPAPAPSKPGTIQSTEGSGLIDIRAMAASTLKAPSGGGPLSFGGDSRGGVDDLPAFGAFASAAPVLLSIPSSSGPPKWVYALVALAAVMIIAVGAAAFSILGKPVIVEQPPAPAAVPAPEPSAKAKESPAAEAAKPIAAGDLPPREGGETGSAAGEKAAGEKAAASDKGTKSGKRGQQGKGKGKGSSPAAGAAETKSGGAVAAASASAAAPPEVEKKPVKGSLDDLLDNALNNKKSKPRVDDDAPAASGRKAAGEASGGGGSGPLAKGAVVAGMNGVKGKVSGCYAQYKVPGMAMVNVVISKSGKVSGATVTGKFAGTPTGACVENAVKTASFPPSEGLTTPYPFSLR